MNPPNLFSFATNELSQDAFLAWLLSWGQPGMDQHDPTLHQLGTAFLHALLGTQEPIHHLKVRQQYHKIDVMAIVNDQKVILIEDKVNASEGPGQLTRYRQVVEKNYPNHLLIPIYLKTGDQSSFAGIEQAGYRAFLRKDLLGILQLGIDQGSPNAILQDFYAHLKHLDETVESFRHLPPEQWFDHNWNPWRGFYAALQAELGTGDWSYIAQANGGFLGYWWGGSQAQTPGGSIYQRYLQLEFGKLCFKISGVDASERRDVRDAFRHNLLKAAPQHQLKLKKNGRLGKSMTVAVLDEPFPLVGTDGKLDMKATVHKIHQVEALLKAVA